MKRCAWVLLVVLAASLPGCAPHRMRLDPTPWIDATARLVEADALVRQGCYRCLQDALGIYESLLRQGDIAPAAGLRAFDAALLLGVRERELGLGGGTAFDAARRLAAGLSAPYETAARLAVAESTPWKGSGVSRERVDELFSSLRRARQEGRAWRDSLASAPQDDVATRYLLATFDCSNQSRLREWNLERASIPDSDPALLQFREATCDGLDPERLTALADRDPRFAEVHLFLGELSLRAGRLVTAERHLSQALEAIPDLVAARVALGSVYQAIEDFDAALEAFTEVVAAVPTHREGLLGKAITLSYTGHYADAVPVLDEMVRLGTWYQGEAFYWRAWNRYRLGEYDAADADAAESRQRLPMDPLVDKLTGLIAYAKGDLLRAEGEFRTAIGHLEGRMTRDCDVEYYLASTLVAQKKWPVAAPYFQSALGCYEETETSVRRRIGEIAASEMGEERKARLIAAKERDIVAMHAQQGRSAYNAAVAYMNAGDPDQCKPMAVRAAEFPDFANQAQALLAKLK